jgi:adenylate cyclase
VAFVDEHRRRADTDRALATAIRGSAATIVLGYFFHMNATTLEYVLPPKELERRLGLLEGSRYPLVATRAGATARPPLLRAYAPEVNLPTFTEAAASSGYFSLQSGPDGILRAMPLAIQAGEDLFPPLAVLCAWHYLGRPQLAVRIGRHGVDGVQIGDRLVPTDATGQVLINYLGPPKTFPHVSVTDVLRGRLPAGTVKDRIVLVGATALGTYDLRSTPFSPLYPGMEVHATVIDNILTRQFLARPEWSDLYDVVAIVLLGALAGLAVARLSPLRGFLVVTGLFLLYVVLAREAFARFGVWLNMVYPLLALVATATAVTVHSYVTEHRERRRIKGTFRQYVAPLVVEEMLKNPGRLTLGGEEKILSVLFSDLEGFTTHSERYSPRELAEMLSEYYNRVTEQVFLHRGTLKEYIGDELMVIFGAPLEQEDHAHRACAAALAMREARLALAAEWAAIGRPVLRARTGINSGPMLVGNLGSKYRFAYGVLGDHVNLGSRLEGLNKVYDTDILVGENTARMVEGGFVLREVDTVRVKGKQQAGRVYELLARGGDALPPGRMEALARYAEGLTLYREQRWAEARTLFAQALVHWPDDGPSRAMADRCKVFQDTPPPEEWEGIFEPMFK